MLPFFSHVGKRRVKAGSYPVLAKEKCGLLGMVRSIMPEVFGRPEVSETWWGVGRAGIGRKLFKQSLHGRDGGFLMGK